MVEEQKIPILDITKLEAVKSRAARPFLKIRKPEPDGTKYAYRLKFTGEPYEVENKRFERIETHCIAELLACLNDDDPFSGYGKGTSGPCRLNLSTHAVLLRTMLENKPLSGKTFDIMIRGYVTGKRSKYYDYAILEQKGRLTVARMLELFETVFEEE